MRRGASNNHSSQDWLTEGRDYLAATPSRLQIQFNYFILRGLKPYLVIYALCSSLRWHGQYWSCPDFVTLAKTCSGIQIQTQSSPLLTLTTPSDFIKQVFRQFLQDTASNLLCIRFHYPKLIYQYIIALLEKVGWFQFSIKKWVRIIEIKYTYKISLE